jgi:hypothetical protein
VNWIHLAQDIIIIIYIFIFNWNWVDGRWQQYSTHLHINGTQNTQNGTYITIKRKENWEVRAVPRLCELYPGICFTTEEKARKNLSLGSRKVPRYPGGSSPVHIYTHTIHRKHSETEYTERNIHSNKNT